MKKLTIICCEDSKLVYHLIYLFEVARMNFGVMHLIPYASTHVFVVELQVISYNGSHLFKIKFSTDVVPYQEDKYGKMKFSIKEPLQSIFKTKILYRVKLQCEISQSSISNAG